MACSPAMAMPPADMKMADGMNYNKYFPGHQIAMPPPLQRSRREEVDQMARDVTAFLAWAAEPETESRKETGVGVLLFLVILSAMMFATKKKIWCGTALTSAALLQHEWKGRVVDPPFRDLEPPCR